MTLRVPTYDLYGETRGPGPDFWIHCETIASRSSAHHWEIGLHRHDIFQQILYIRSGSGDAILGEDKLALAPPCIVCVPPGIHHGFRFSKDIDGLVVTFLADRLPRVTGLVRRPQDWLSAPRLLACDHKGDTDYLDATFSRLFSELTAQCPGSNALVETCLKAAVLILDRMAGSEPGAPPISGKLSRVEALETLVSRHFREQWSVTDYARALNLTPTHLNRVTREALGMTVHDLVMARVIEEACRSLVFTASSVRLVAEQLGFADAAYFARCFHKRTGTTPRHYRERERRRMQEHGPNNATALTQDRPL